MWPWGNRTRLVNSKSNLNKVVLITTALKRCVYFAGDRCPFDQSMEETRRITH